MHVVPAATLLLLGLLGACSSVGHAPGTNTDAGAAAPAAAAPAPPPWTLVHEPVDDAQAQALEPVLAEGVRTVERFFGAPFAEPFVVTVHPERASFDLTLPPEWGIGKSECWMVASGVAAGLQLLSPRAWKAEACEHDAANARHVRDLIAHELVHVFHGQHNPSPDFVAVTGIDWFVEGLATYASGQLAAGDVAPAREALERGTGPKELATAWSGKYRYGVSGSLVAFLDLELGRARLVELLDATSAEELLPRIGMDEPELLERWRAWVLGAP